MILKVEESETGLATLEFLQQRIPAAPRAYLRQLLKNQKIVRDGFSLTEEDHLSCGDVLSLPSSKRLRELCSSFPEPPLHLDILYESREILVAAKPAGIAVHQSQGHEQLNLTDLVKEVLSGRGEQFQVAPIHRLDLQTSGPVLFGKGRRACAELGRMFMRHEVDKEYLALVAGKTASVGKLMGSLAAKGKSKSVALEFHALRQNTTASLLAIRLGTGRQHQIRRQLAATGHPLYGDQRYGGPCPANLERLFLHCSRLAFVDPFSGAQLDMASPLPEDLQVFADSCLSVP